MEERFQWGLEGKVPLATSEIDMGGRAWQVTAVQNQDALLDAADELEHFPYGFLLWESAVGLGRYLAENRQLVRGKRVLELGTGVGVAGMVAQSLGAKVWQTDHQQGALQLAQRNAIQNGVADIECFLADWRTWSHPARYDVILGADITYERGMHFFLEEIFRGNLRRGGRILLSDPGRPQSLEFAALLEKRGWYITVETVAVSLMENGEEGKSVEVAILSMTPG